MMFLCTECNETFVGTLDDNAHVTKAEGDACGGLGVVFVDKVVGKSFGRDYIRVTLSVSNSYFSATYERWHGRKNATGQTRMQQGRDWDNGGSDHELILKYFPELKPFVDLHLSDFDGVPVHALANSWYFYSGGAERYEAKHDYARSELSGHDRAAKTLRVKPDDLPTGMDRDQFILYFNRLLPDWQTQAREAILWFNNLFVEAV